MAPLTVGVTGASGFLGGALCEALAANGHTVRRFVRGRAAGAGEIAWDPAGGSLEPDTLAGLDAVVHLSGASIAGRRWTAERKRELAESRVRSTDTLARAIARCERRPRVLLSGSAVGWYGDRGEEALDESSTPGTGFLAGLAQAWELVAGPARDAGVRVVHLRTGLVLARGRGVLGELAPLFALGLGGPLGPGDAWWSWIALADYLSALQWAIVSDGVTGPLNVVSPSPVRQREFARALGHALRRPAVLAAPAFALRALLGRERADEVLLASQRVTPSALLGAGFRFAQPDLPACLMSLLA